MSTVTQLRDRAPLTDIAGCLRALAADVEAGRVQAETVVVVWDDPDAIVAGAVYGQMPDRFGIAGMLCCAAAKASTGSWQ